ncbi:MAG: phosphate transporter [Gammaproteobacteria bacterium]|nr:MAG: phosphate transporter [Gammaproteobacteria bacterium]
MLQCNGTSVGAKALTLTGQSWWRGLEFAGAYPAGGEVTQTIRKGIIDPIYLLTPPLSRLRNVVLVVGGGDFGLLVASIFGWPVSTTHSIVGAIVGFAAVCIGSEFVQWGKVGSIASSWVVSPLLAGTISFGIFKSVQILILDRPDQFQRAQKFIPGYIFLVGFVICMVTLLKGLKHVGIQFSAAESLALAAAFGAFLAVVGRFLISRIKETAGGGRQGKHSDLEKVFAVLMVFTACSMAFAHGSNDVANAVGPLAAVVNIVQSGGSVVAKSALPGWVLLVGASGIVLGLVMLGYRVIETVGRNITELTPSRGFAAELAAATTVVVASGASLPISTTHTLVGAVLGVGLARGIGAIDVRVVGKIILSWIVTLPAGASLSILFFYTFKGIFG